MAFSKKDRDKLLVACRRRCCVCYRFCGSKIEIHHIKQRAKGGADTLDNAIPLCFDCHAEVKHYNPEHPKGTKFSDEELKMHRDAWLNLCETNPSVLVNAPREADIGPLESLLLELEFNLATLSIKEEGPASTRICGLLKDKEYDRAVSAGVFSLFTEEVKNNVMEAYKTVARVNHKIEAYATVPPEGNAHAEAVNRALASIRDGYSSVKTAYDTLRDFLS